MVAEIVIRMTPDQAAKLRDEIQAIGVEHYDDKEETYRLLLVLQSVLSR